MRLLKESWGLAEPDATVRRLRIAMGVASLIAVAGLALVLGGVLDSQVACVVAAAGWAGMALIYPALCIVSGKSGHHVGVDDRLSNPLGFWSGLLTYTTLLWLLSAAAVVYLIDKINTAA